MNCFLILLLSSPGDWSISIFYENAHIQGSPFQVRVYDAAQVKVFGLEGGAVGQTFSFSGKLNLNRNISFCPLL